MCGSEEIRQQLVNDLFGPDAFDDSQNIATDDYVWIMVTSLI